MDNKTQLCPICGLPRGNSNRGIDHGMCMEKRAKTEGKVSAKLGEGDLNRITVEQHEKAKRRSAANRYISGKLPKWMTNK